MFKVHVFEYNLNKRNFSCVIIIELLMCAYKVYRMCAESKFVKTKEYRFNDQKKKNKDKLKKK